MLGAAAAVPWPQKADEVAQEKNRALKAAMNAELRKAKAFLMEDSVPKLAKMVKKGKNLTQQKIDERLRKVGPDSWRYGRGLGRPPGSDRQASCSHAWQSLPSSGRKGRVYEHALLALLAVLGLPSSSAE